MDFIELHILPHSQRPAEQWIGPVSEERFASDAAARHKKCCKKFKSGKRCKRCPNK
jgi:hypothetical protein